MQNVPIFNPVEKFGGAFLVADGISFLITVAVDLSSVAWSLISKVDGLALFSPDAVYVLPIRCSGSHDYVN